MASGNHREAGSPLLQQLTSAQDVQESGRDAEPSLGSASSALLEVRSLTKAFGGVQALVDVSLDVAAGEVHSLLGENGAGKSTLVKVISGALRPDSGDVRLRGEEFAPRSPDESSRTGLGVVFQELPLIPDLTVMENVYFNRQPQSWLATISRRKLRAKTEELFAELGIPGIPPDQMVGDLSLAARQFVAIAKVMADDPAVVVFDEATSALGPSGVSWFLGLMRQLASADKGIVFISHRLAEVEEISDRVTVLRNGARVGSWRLGEVDSDELVSAMLGRKLEQLYPPRTAVLRNDSTLRVEQLRVGRRVRGVDLEVRAGEIVGVCGLEGQGQRELFLALYGVLRSTGAIFVEGVEHRIRSPRDAIDAGVGIACIPEDRKNEGILPTLSVRENLTLPSLKKISRFGVMLPSRERALVKPVIGELQIGSGDREQVVGKLSGGNQQKVVIGKFLLAGIKVLLVYDLTRGVDVGTKAAIFQKLEDLAAEGYAVLFYSTDLAELVNVPHRVIVIFDGEIIQQYQQGEFTEDQLVSAMVGRSETLANPTAAPPDALRGNP